MPRTESIGSYLDALAGSAPTPGGGAAAAWTLAQAAALLAMVCRLTQGKAGDAEREDAIRGILADVSALQAAAESLADLDSLAFQAYGAALKLPKDGAEAAERRSPALRSALEDAAAVPLALHELAAELLRPAGALDLLARLGNPRVLSDVAVAQYLALAALGASKENVRVNLRLFKDPTAAEALELRLGSSEARALGKAEAGADGGPRPGSGAARVQAILAGLNPALRGRLGA